jgi:hypothetical protein
MRGEARIARQVAAQYQRVDEEADQAAELGPHATGDRPARPAMSSCPL